MFIAQGLKKILVRCMPDSIYLKRKYYRTFGRKLDLKNPQSFNEKLNWLKLHDRKPIYTTMVDKYAVKQYVAERIGTEHVIPCYGVWNAFDEIDFEKLPNQFVLKCTHDSGSFAICKDKASFDADRARRILEPAMKKNFYYQSREWPYKHVKPRILAEKYIDSLGKPESYEYKLTCGNGEVKFITICTGIAHDKPELRTNDTYDKNMVHQPWYATYKNAPVPPKIPVQMNEMISYAEKLSENTPSVRVDFYIIDGAVYFGEFTFYTWGGFIDFTPPEYDMELGKLIQVKSEKTNRGGV